MRHHNFYFCALTFGVLGSMCIHTTPAELTVNSLGATMNPENSYMSSLQIDCSYASKDFLPDGNLGKSVWKKTQRQRMDRDWQSGRRMAESETYVASVWTDQFVYFAFWCKYTVLNIYEGEATTKERWELWNRDVVEVFLNPNPGRMKHYYEFEVSPNNQWIDLEIDLSKNPFNEASWDSQFEHATRSDTKNHLWTCEMRIPLKSIRVEAIHPGQEWRLNFYRADGPGDDSRRRFLGWSPNPSNKPTFHQPESFGLIRFTR
jgi:hypothetical protein